MLQRVVAQLLERSMVAFEVSVNGRRICIATTDCVLSAIMSWTPSRENKINFHVGGIQAAARYLHCDWEVPEIGIGDEVTIRIVEADSPEPAPMLRKLQKPRDATDT